MGLQFPGGSASHDDPHHTLPGRVAASESSSTCPDTKKSQKPMKKPSRKMSGDDDDDEPVCSEHEPLGGADDDDHDDDTLSNGNGDDGVPRDLKPKNVMKKPGARATSTMKRPSSKRSKKNEDWF